MWSKMRLSLPESTRIRPKPSNSDAFWTSPTRSRPDAAKPRRILDHSAHCHHAHAHDPRMRHPHCPTKRAQRVPRRAHPSQGEPPPGAHARNRRPAGHKGNTE